MRKVHWSKVAAAPVPAPAVGVRIRWLIDDTTGAPNFAMRHFEIAPGGQTPLHAHGWEHEVFILSGAGTVTAPEGESALAPGDVVFVPAGEEHCFRNTGTAPLTMLCLVPLSAKKG